MLFWWLLKAFEGGTSGAPVSTVWHTNSWVLLEVLRKQISTKIWKNWHCMLSSEFQIKLFLLIQTNLDGLPQKEKNVHISRWLIVIWTWMNILPDMWNNVFPCWWNQKLQVSKRNFENSKRIIQSPRFTSVSWLYGLQGKEFRAWVQNPAVGVLGWPSQLSLRLSTLA